MKWIIAALVVVIIILILVVWVLHSVLSSITNAYKDVIKKHRG